MASRISNIGEIIRASGVKQEELARLCKVGQSTISSWVTGRTLPTLDNAIILCKRLSVSMNRLYGIVDTIQDSNNPLDKQLMGEIVYMSDDQKEALLQFIHFLKSRFSILPAPDDVFTDDQIDDEEPDLDSENGA